MSLIAQKFLMQANQAAQEGRRAEAIDLMRQAIIHEPDSAFLHLKLGFFLQSHGDIASAVEAFQTSMLFDPKAAATLLHCITGMRGPIPPNWELATRQALQEHRPNDADWQLQLGLVMQEAHDVDAAIACFTRAANVGSVEGLNNLATALKARGEIDAAMAAHDRAIALRPDDPVIAGNRLYTLLYHPDFDSQAILREHLEWAKRFADPLTTAAAIFANSREQIRKLRIAYISPDFRNHCQTFFTLPLFRALDRSQIELYCYSDVPTRDEATKRLRELADHWREIAEQPDEAVANLIREDHIDVLIDLSLHMANNRLLVFARRAAPVQLTCIAYPGTSGLSAMDIRLTDPQLDPPGEHDADYAERSVRLPETFWCFDPMMDLPSGELPADQNGFVTFGCLNNFCKVNDAVLDLWVQVLKSIEHSQLILLAPAGIARQHVSERLAAGGIEANRVEFFDRARRTPYFQAYAQIDIALDTFPYNGHTTTLDGLWMGVPVVTLVGKTVVGRAGLSMLSNVGLADLATETPQEFVRLAAELATDRARLTELRKNLRERVQQSPLMDAGKFARNAEAVYRSAFDAWRMKGDSRNS